MTQGRTKIIYTLRIADIIDLLYGLKNRDPESSQKLGPYLVMARSGRPHERIRVLNKPFFERHYFSEFVKWLEGFGIYDGKGNISADTRRDLNGTSKLPKGSGSRIKKKFVEMIANCGSDENGQNRDLAEMIELNREVLRPFDLGPLKSGLETYIEGIPAAEKQMPKDVRINDYFLEKFRYFCQKPLQEVSDTDFGEELLDACAESLTWLLIGALLRQEIENGKIVSFYAPASDTVFPLDPEPPIKRDIAVISAANQEEDTDKIIYNFRKNTDTVYGREEKITQIEALFGGQQPGQTRIVYIQGIGGIGKSTLAKAYAEKHSGEYNVIAEVSAVSAQEAVMKLPSTVPTDRSFQEKLNRIGRICNREKVLLIVHDYNNPSDRSYGTWADIGCDILLTGWSDRRSTGVKTVLLRTEDLSDTKEKDAACNIFIEAYLKDAEAAEDSARIERLKKITEEEYDSIRQLCALAGYHPLTLKVIAMQSSCTAYAEVHHKVLLKELSEKGLAEKGLADDSSEHENRDPFILVRDGTTEYFGDAAAHLRDFFLTAAGNNSFSQGEFNCLANMILVPYEWGISAERFNVITGIGRQNLSMLCKKGWIEYDPGQKDVLGSEGTDRGVYRMPMALKEVHSGMESTAACIDRCYAYTEYYLSTYPEDNIEYLVREALCCIGEMMVRYLKEEDSIRYAEILHHCADDMHSTLSRPYRSELSMKTEEKALQMFLRHLGENDRRTAESYSFLGMCYAESGILDKGLQYVENGMKIRQMLYGENSEEAARSYGYLGTVYEKTDTEKAYFYNSKGLQIYRRIYDSGISDRDPLSSKQFYIDLSSGYDCVGKDLWALRKWEEGLEYMETALEIRKKELGENSDQTASSYNNVGHCYYVLGDDQKGLEFIEKGLKIRLNVLGENNSKIAFSYDNLGCCYDKIGEPDKCLEDKKKALLIRRNALGEENTDTAESYNSYGGSLWKYTNSELGLEYMKRALEIRLALLGEDSDLTARSFIDVGTCTIESGDSEGGIRYLEKALAIRRKLFGEESEVTARSHYFIAISYAGIGDYANALEHAAKAYEISIRLPDDGNFVAVGSKDLMDEYRCHL